MSVGTIAHYSIATIRVLKLKISGSLWSFIAILPKRSFRE
jgi:hypothetical protein